MQHLLRRQTRFVFLTQCERSSFALTQTNREKGDRKWWWHPLN
jgi:hypothetical protein